MVSPIEGKESQGDSSWPVVFSPRGSLHRCQILLFLRLNEFFGDGTVTTQYRTRIVGLREAWWRGFRVVLQELREMKWVCEIRQVIKLTILAGLTYQPNSFCWPSQHFFKEPEVPALFGPPSPRRDRSKSQPA